MPGSSRYTLWGIFVDDVAPTRKDITVSTVIVTADDFESTIVDEELITKVRELDMDEVRATIAARA